LANVSSATDKAIERVRIALSGGTRKPKKAGQRNRILRRKSATKRL
jgi:hypothetical protein